jgi:hypothetical protein
VAVLWASVTPSAKCDENLATQSKMKIGQEGRMLDAAGTGTVCNMDRGISSEALSE